MRGRADLPEPGELAARIDHTLLRPAAVGSDFQRLCREAEKYRFWSVCVPPSRAKLAADMLEGTGVRVCTVVGFPLGYSRREVKVAEARQALREEVDEIDMVMNVGAFKEGERVGVSSEIRDVALECAAGGRLLKVIIECCYLTDGEKVEAAKMAERQGADFIKTSTGFGPSGATVKDVSLLQNSLAGKARVKAAGGIDSLEKALQMLGAGADRLGTSSSVAIMDELALLGRTGDPGRRLR